MIVEPKNGVSGAGPQFCQPMKKQTYVVHDVHDERHQGAATVPIYQNSLFTFAKYDEFEAASDRFFDHFVYSRGNNPTVRELENRLAVLEGGEDARCFASGMAAISAAVMSIVKQGDHIVCVDEAYGPTRGMIGTYLRKFGVEATFADGTSLQEVQSAIRPNTTLLYLESPSTLYFNLQDLQACAKMAKQAGIVTIIDNTWATPCFQNPLRYGIDLVVHSITKYIGGHSDVLGGVVVGSAKQLQRLNQNEYIILGGLMTSHTAALALRGLRTLPLRLERHQTSGIAIAEFLEALPIVRKVNHPALTTHPQHQLAQRQMEGYGSLFSFEPDIPLQDMKRWAEHLKYFHIGVSWGGYESLVTVNGGAREENSNDDSADCVVRLYIGLEDPYDLTDDILSAFVKIGA